MSNIKMNIATLVTAACLALAPMGCTKHKQSNQERDYQAVSQMVEASNCITQDKTDYKAMCADPVAFYNSLNPKQKKLVDSYDLSNVDPALKEEINQNAPWIDLERAGLKDRLAVALYQDHWIHK